MKFVPGDEWGCLRGILQYDPADYGFAFEPSSLVDVQDRIGGRGTTSILLGTLQIEFGVENGFLLYVWGYHPQTSWIEGHLIAPRSHPGCVRVELDAGARPGVSLELAKVNEWPTIRDPATGWLCIGTADTGDADCVEFAEDTVAVTRKQSLVGLWLRPILPEASS